MDSRVVRIPRACAFFPHEQDCGYIVMESIEGKVIDLLKDISAIEKIAGMLEHFATLPSASLMGILPASI